jgi:hypothetical protein
VRYLAVEHPLRCSDDIVERRANEADAFAWRRASKTKRNVGYCDSAMPVFSVGYGRRRQESGKRETENAEAKRARPHSNPRV